jgi:hypothetical protein
MAERNSIEAQLRIEGEVSPSVKRSMDAAIGMMQKIQSDSSKVVNSLNNVWGAAALGGAVGGTVAAAWGKVTSVIEGTISKVREFSAESLKVAKNADKQLGAFSRTINNQKGAALLAERFEVLGMSNFGQVKLMEVAGKLSRYGVRQRYLQGQTMTLAKVALGAGTGEEGLDALTDTYGRVRTRGYMTLRDVQAAERQGGVRHEDIVKMAGGEDRLAQLLHDKKFTAAMFSRVLIGETQGEGPFAKVLEKIKDTFGGQMNLIRNHTEELEKLFGRIEEKLLKPMLQWFNNSGIWQAGEEWMAKASKWADEILQYFQTSAIGEKFTAAFASLRKAWDSFNGWLGSFFQTYDPVSGKVIGGLNAEGADKLTKMFSSISDMIYSAADFASSESFRICTTMAWDTITFGIKELFLNLREIFDLVADIKTGNWGKLWEDIKRYELGGESLPKETGTKKDTRVDKLAGVAELRNKENARFDAERAALDATYQGGAWHTQEYNQRLREITEAHERQLKKIDEATKASSGQTDATKAATDAIKAFAAQAQQSAQQLASINPMAAFGLRSGYGAGTGGWAGTPGDGTAGDGWSKVFEQYSWEGSAANYHNGRYLGSIPNEVGIGPILQRKWGVSTTGNDWALIQMGDGTQQWRHIAESSEVPAGIEFWSDQRNKYLQHGSKARILRVSHGEPTASATPVTINNNVYALDSHGVDRVMQAHGDRILDHLNKLNGNRQSQRTLATLGLLRQCRRCRLP